ncbi:MAG TPA: basic amino acid ABC transporter substrate-binding protein [Dermatophilaceae bacterium]|nr:basic amino acid ABC transporter substrate-binding protein [Dermatophilaceae bacterium]
MSRRVGSSWSGRIPGPVSARPVRSARSARTLTAGVAALGSVLLVAGCGSGSSSGPATVAGGVRLVAADKLTVCTHLPYAPFQFNEGGKVVGFDMDLMDLVAKKLGVTQAVVDTPFEGIKSGQDLNTGKCDVAAAGMTIKPERAKVIDFSAPYFNATQALLVRKGAPYTSLESFKGKKLGVQSGTTGKDYVASKKLSGVTVTEFEDLATLQQALATNQIEGAVDDLPVWTDYIKKNPGKFEIGAEFDTGEQYGFGIRKGGNPQLLKTVNDVIASSKSDGTYDAIYEKWFGTKPAA